jgi:N4-gp56 family major capsid protein
MGVKTEFLTNDALTRKRWAKDLFAVILPAVEFNDLVGTGSDSVVQIRTELGKGEGDTITFGIRLPLTGEGVVGNDTLEGNEEKLIFKDFAMTIEELNHAVDTGGKMEEQRVPYNLMQEGKNGLQDWWAEKLSYLAINTLAGVTSYTIAGKSFGSAITAPDVYHHVGVNQADEAVVATAEAAITAADVVDLDFLDRMKQRAEMPLSTAFKLRPIKVGGKNYYRVILHNFCFDQLRRNMNVGQWGDMQRAAGKLGLANVEFEYNGMLVSKSERIPKVASVTGGGGVYRNLLLGAQAACWAWGGAGESKSSVMAFVPYEKDAKRFINIRGGGIFGIKKTVFNSMDYGVIVGSAFGDRIS